MTFEIRRTDDALIDIITTDKRGRAYLDLEDGAYYALEVDCPGDFKLDSTPIYFTVKDGRTVSKTVTNEPLGGIIIHKIDSTTGEGIYGVKFVLYDSAGTPLKEVTTDPGRVCLSPWSGRGQGAKVPAAGSWRPPRL